MNALFKMMLRGSAIGALTLVGVGAGCSSDDNGGTTPGAAGDDSGGSSSAGKSSGGTKSDAGEPGAGGDRPNGGSGGTNAGGDNVGGDNVGGDPGLAGAPPIGPAEGGSPAFGAGGETGTGTGPSVAKFCNTLEFQGADTTMILEIGEGAEKVTFTATTGECAPPDGEECKEIPQGDDVVVAMFDADDTSEPLDVKGAPVGAGEDWVFWTDLEVVGDQNQPVIAGTTINQNVATCEEIVYDDIP